MINVIYIWNAFLPLLPSVSQCLLGHFPVPLWMNFQKILKSKMEQGSVPKIWTFQTALSKKCVFLYDNGVSVYLCICVHWLSGRVWSLSGLDHLYDHILFSLPHTLDSAWYHHHDMALVWWVSQYSGTVWYGHGNHMMEVWEWYARDREMVSLWSTPSLSLHFAGLHSVQASAVGYTGQIQFQWTLPKSLNVRPFFVWTSSGTIQNLQKDSTVS